ncbi:DUF6090 family protein [Aquimarina sp. AU474]|uniref:DUF6090 family protein n=1 Tax=Aquimarina sp. AU474 TaxID=2108529 RepID=UPI000D69794B|nr:DUF6090 family protein [Aquimarina sp. AU474]
MIKIFRKIRQNALAKNKFSKYIFYAVGEIVLVVIGILIALQLNSQKAKADQNQKQRNYLALIKGEMKNNLVALSNEKKDLGTIIADTRTILNLMDSDSAIVALDESKLSDLLFMPITRAISMNYENGAFIELISSGGLKDIQNDSIRGVLRSWESKLTTVQDQERAVKKSLNKTINHIQADGYYKVVFDDIGLSEELGVNNSSRTSSNKHLLKSKKLENILLNYLGVADQLYEKTYPNFESDMNSLIKLINQELNDKE